MSCEDFVLLISGHLDNENTPEQEAQLRAHLQTCPDCRRLLTAWQTLEPRVQALAEPAPEGLKQSVMDRIAAQSGPRLVRPAKRFRLNAGAKLGLAAACLILLVGVGAVSLPKLGSKPASADALEKASAVTEAATTELTVYGEAVPEEAPAEQTFGTAPDAPEAAEPAPGPESTDVMPAATDAPAQTEPDDYYRSGSTDADGASAQRRPNVDISRADWKRCMDLSLDNTAPVLLYTEFGPSLLDLLQTEAPELYDRFAELTPETSEDGSLVYTTTYGDIMALQEWLLARLPRSEDQDEEARAAEFEVMKRFYELDPDSGMLNRVITLRPGQSPVQWPADWPEDWARRLRLEENWSLFFPEEDFSPMADDLAFLVLLDDAEQTP